MQIPKILHTVWIGDKPIPWKWINTWKEKHPEWEHIMWDNDKVFGRTWRNQRHIDYLKERKMWAAIADVIRYEYLHEYGGFAGGADSVCLNPIDELFNDENFDAYTCYENERVTGKLVSPLLGCSKGNELANNLIEMLAMKEKLGDTAWLTTGNLFMMNAINALEYPRLKIFPSHYFLPEHHSGAKYRGSEKSYATHMWGTGKNANETIGKEEPKKSQAPTGDAKIFIAIPNLGTLHSELVKRLIEWHVTPMDGVEQVGVYMPRGIQPHDSARNHCVQKFLESECTHMLFIDSDVIPPSDTILKLLEHDVPVVSGNYPFIGAKEDGTVGRVPCMFKLVDVLGTGIQKMVPMEDVDGMQEIDFFGGGCLMIRRDVLENMKAPHFKWQYTEDGMADYGEDIDFGKKLIQMNIQAYGRFDVQCQHYKAITI